MKVDKRKHYYIVLDTETANSLDDPLVYDLGFAIIDKKGNVYHMESLLIYDIYVQERELMDSAYYAEKIPMYEKNYRLGLHKMVRFNTARKKIHDLCEKWDIKAIIAHNAIFDYKALSTTQRFLTKSKYRYFLPYNIPIWCTMTMARDTIAKQKAYQKYCEKNNFLTASGRVRLTAEVLYSYIIQNPDYKEEHTGLEDVLIEKEIFVRCLQQKKKMKKEPWATEPDKVEYYLPLKM